MRQEVNKPETLLIDRAGLSDFRDFSFSFLAKCSIPTSRDSRNCLNPKGEFCGCSGMSLRTTEKYLRKRKPAISISIQRYCLSKRIKQQQIYHIHKQYADRIPCQKQCFFLGTVGQADNRNGCHQYG